MSAILQLGNANVYLNGQTLIGKVKEIELPKVKPLMNEVKPLGMMSAIDLPLGFEKMTTKLTMNAFYLKDFLQVSNFFVVNSLIIRANQGGFDTFGNTSNKKLMISLAGLVNEIDLGKYAQNTATDLPLEMTVQSLLVQVDDVPVITVNVFTNTFITGALDLLLAFKQNS